MQHGKASYKSQSQSQTGEGLGFSVKKALKGARKVKKQSKAAQKLIHDNKGLISAINPKLGTQLDQVDHAISVGNEI